MRQTRRSASFTILEILIAIVILVLGISGIVALFPSAIQSGNKTIEDSYSAAITQSVIDAVSVGMRKHAYIRRAYQLGRYRKGQEKAGFPSPAQAPGPIRDEFLG